MNYGDTSSSIGDSVAQDIGDRKYINHWLLQVVQFGRLPNM